MKVPIVRQKISEMNLMLDLRDPLVEVVIDAFLETGTLLQSEAGTVLLNEGDGLGNIGFILVDGTAGVTKSDGVNTEIKAPALFGEMQQFSISGTRSATVKLETESTVINFDWENFYQYLDGVLKTHEVQSVREAIRRQSWQHFLASETD